MRWAVRIALVVVLAAVLVPAFASACPLCKDAKADTDYAGGTASLPNGFYYSILLMVSAPFLVVGGLVLRIWLARRRNAAIASADAAPSPAAAPPARLVPDSPGAQP
jgi:hypothetical protein